MARFGMAIDTKKCIGCKTCLMACKVSNNLPEGVWYAHLQTVGSQVELAAVGEYPDLNMACYTASCRHCENAPCAQVCPTGATSVDSNGIVSVDPDSCIGCKACMDACPYGARTYIEEVVHYLDIAVGRPGAPAHKPGTVEKCGFCKDLVEAGGVPACMDLCPGRARVWGDLDDPESDISVLLSSREHLALPGDEQTAPKVFYLV